MSASMPDKLLNFTDSRNETSAVMVTRTEIWIQLIFFYFVLCALSTCGNVAMTVGIFKSKKLRSRFFIFVAGLISARIVLGSQFLVVSTYRILRTLNLVETNIKRGWCFLVHLHLPYVMTLELIFLLIMVVDKMIAVISFNFYRNLTNRRAIDLCLYAFLIALTFKGVPSLIGIDFFEIIPCINVYSPVNPIFAIYTQNLDVAIALLILILYLILIFYVRFFYETKKTDNINSTEAIGLKRQMKLMPLLRRLVLIHCGFSLASKLLLSFASFFPESTSQRFVLYGGNLVVVDLFANTIVLLTSNKDLRQASLSCKSNAVGSL